MAWYSLYTHFITRLSWDISKTSSQKLRWPGSNPQSAKHFTLGEYVSFTYLSKDYNITFYLIFMYVSVLPAGMPIHHRGQKRTSDSLELAL